MVKYLKLSLFENRKVPCPGFKRQRGTFLNRINLIIKALVNKANPAHYIKEAATDIHQLRPLNQST